MKRQMPDTIRRLNTLLMRFVNTGTGAASKSEHFPNTDMALMPVCAITVFRWGRIVSNIGNEDILDNIGLK